MFAFQWREKQLFFSNGGQSFTDCFFTFQMKRLEFFVRDHCFDSKFQHENAMTQDFKAIFACVEKHNIRTISRLARFPNLNANDSLQIILV